MPNGLTPEQIEFWSKALDKVLEDPDFKKDLALNFWVPRPIRYPDTVKWMQDDYDENRAVLKELGNAVMSRDERCSRRFGPITSSCVSPQGEELLYVDFNLINEGQSFLAFDQLRMEGRTARRPQQHLAVTDHYLPTINRDRGPAGMPNPEIRRVVEMMDENATEFGCRMSAGSIPTRASRM